MKNLEELQAQKPNLLRVAQELSTYENPYKVPDALMLILQAGVKEARR